MNAEHLPPQALDAEDSLIGAALLSADALAILVEQAAVEDFYKPSNKLIAMALRRIWDRGERSADPILVANELTSLGELEAVGGPSTLITLQANTPATTNAGRYASIVTEKATSRRLIEVGLAIQDLGYVQPDINQAVGQARSLIERVNLPPGNVEPSMTAQEFLTLEQPEDWLIPGLMERMDRLMLTAREGLGKSTFLRQLGIQAASGIHPFDGKFFEPIRVLLIDCENSVGQIQRQLRSLVARAGENLVNDNFRVETRGEGLDLMQRHDTQWLFGKVAANKPDLVIIGPLYKMHSADPTEEGPARQVAKVLDEVRIRYGCALMMEAHSPKGTNVIEPYGASLWLRWPEFGYGIRPLKASDHQFKFDEWRGPRAARSWPARIQKGGPWLWTAVPEQTRAF